MRWPSHTTPGTRLQKSVCQVVHALCYASLVRDGRGPMHEQAAVALAATAVARSAEMTRLDMQRVPSIASLGSFSDGSVLSSPRTTGINTGMAKSAASSGQAALHVRTLAVHEALTALLYIALNTGNCRGLLAVRPSLEVILEMWESFSLPFSPIAVTLQGEEVLCSSDLDLCVGLLFSLAADLEHARPELQVSQSSRSALRGKGWSRPVCLSVAPSCPPRPALREREVITDGVGCCRRWYRQRRCAG